MIGVIDYGAGNLRSVQAALARLGAAWRSVGRPEDLEGIRAAILPGVGRFGTAAARLRELGLAAPLREIASSGRPFLGICLGMQLLFERSEEDPDKPGLGLLPGGVVRLGAERLPHIGWALVETGAPARDGIFRGLPESFFAYFAHSYAVPPAAVGSVACTSCPPAFASAVRIGSTWGVQFHPEKSGETGRRILANFVGLAGGEGGA